MVRNVKREGRTRISSKNQITIPVAVLREARLAVSDQLRVAEVGPGRLLLEKVDDVVAEFAGSLTGKFDRGLLEQLDGEWD